MLSEEQTAAVKTQLIQHIERSFPDERKQYAKEQVENMSPKELEDFLAKNNLIAGHDSGCVFCSIVSGDIPSYKIDETENALAVLEINPVSKGHALIIPKKHIDEDSKLQKEAGELAEKLSKKIKAKLKPKRIDMAESAAFGHRIINLLPVYNDETLSSRRQPAKKEELEEIQELLKTTRKTEEKTKSATPKKSERKKSVIKKVEKAIKNFEEKLWLPQRIP